MVVVRVGQGGEMGSGEGGVGSAGALPAQAGVWAGSSSSLWDSSWWWWWVAEKMEELQGWMPAVV